MNIDLRHPTEAFLRGIDIHELLPQQEPFVMISRLVAFDMTTMVTETDISAENIFTDDGRFSAFGLIENIAQTCAARFGYANHYIFKKSVQIGFIGAIRQFEVYALPQVGQTIRTTVSVQQEVFGMALAAAQVRVGDTLLAKTEMKIAIKGE
jgi:predicted hotdog family 3-hydroxylacyl-ACP dehydratase